MSGPRTLVAGILTALTAATVWMGGCSDPVASLTGLAENELTLIISDTAANVSAGASNTSASTQAQSSWALATSGAEASTSVAYVSLPPGTALGGVAATIQNQQTGSAVTVSVVAGGFDPIAIVARPGDALDIAVRSADGATLLHDIRTVPGKRPPRVVRTYPPRGKRDVALNSIILIVFSEPIDARTLTGASVQFRRAGTAVPGRLEFYDAEHLTAAFTPDVPLTPGSDHELAVTQEVRDLDGEALEQPVTVQFTTLAAESPAPYASSGIAYEGWQREGCGDVFVMEADGSSVRSITEHTTACSFAPAWSPDGTRIAFLRHVNSGESEIHVVNADGSGLKRLTQHPSPKQLSPAAWSPDGKKIVFTIFAEFGGRGAIYIMNADGSGLRLLADRGSQAAWSPDGSKIAFQSQSDADIRVVNADGSGARSLASHPRDDGEPTWSPDGLRIAFYSERDGGGGGGGQIYIMNADGSGVRQVTSQFEWTRGLAWSPDGTRIAFAAYRAGDCVSCIYLINPDGSGLVNLQRRGASPAWSPIAFRPLPGLSLVRAPDDDGNGQRDTVLATLGQPFRVLVTQNGPPAAGVKVFWNLLTWTQGASLSAATTITDAAGIASTTLTFGRREYPMRVEASASGAVGSPVLFDAYANPGNLARILVVMGDGQAGIANTRLENDYIVKTVDAHWDYDHVPAVGLDWAVASGGGAVEPGSFSGCYDMTCYVGDHLASVSHVLGPDYGPQTVTVTASAVPGAPRARFTAFAAGAVVIVGLADERYVCHDGFQPSHVSAPIGSPVVWMPSPDCTQPGDVGYRSHDVTFEDGGAVTPAVWGLASRTFSASGTYRYRCTLHSTSFTEGEVGSVTVR